MHIAPRDGFINFPHLRKFWAVQQSSPQRFIQSTTIVDPAVLESLLAAPLESFVPTAHMASFPLPQLFTFAITSTYGMIYRGVSQNHADKVLQLASHYAPQIRELFIYPAVQGLESSLAPHLAGGDFSCLRSSCFLWVKDPELSILKAIGSNLGTLEELSFSVQPSSRATGTANRMSSFLPPPHHDDILAAISPFHNLVRLGIFSDEFIADWCGGD